jgi:hypothetical protein
MMLLHDGKATMEISVIVMPLPTGAGYKARVGEPWNVAAEAGDPDTAYALLQDQLRPRLPNVAQLVRVDVPVYDRLFDVIGGLDPDSPAWSAWAEEVEAYRRERAQQDEEALRAEQRV